MSFVAEIHDLGFTNNEYVPYRAGDRHQSQDPHVPDSAGHSSIFQNPVCIRVIKNFSAFVNTDGNKITRMIFPNYAQTFQMFMCIH